MKLRYRQTNGHVYRWTDEVFPIERERECVCVWVCCYQFFGQLIFDFKVEDLDANDVIKPVGSLNNKSEMEPLNQIWENVSRSQVGVENEIRSTVWCKLNYLHTWPCCYYVKCSLLSINFVLENLVWWNINSDEQTNKHSLYLCLFYI